MLVRTNWKENLCFGNALEKAELLFSQKRVDMAMYKISGDRVRMRATIIDSGEYHVELAATASGELFGAFCGCQDFLRERGKLCAHCAVALMFNQALEASEEYGYISERGNITAKHVLNGTDCYDRNIDGDFILEQPRKENAASSFSRKNARSASPLNSYRPPYFANAARVSTQKLLQSYAEKDEPELYGEDEEASVCLEPDADLTLFGKGILLSFCVRRLGADGARARKRGSRTYIIKNILDFSRRTEHGSRFSYGRELEFRHSLSVFEPQSRRWVDFIRRWAKKCAQTVDMYMDPTRTQRSFRLSADAMDELFSDFADCEFVFGGQKKPRALFAEGQPKLEMTLYKDNAGIALSFDQHQQVYVGNYVYYYDGECVRRFDSRASDAVKELFLAQSSERGVLVFAADQLADAYGLVIQTVMPYVEIKNIELLSGCAADEFSPVVLADAPDKNTITLTPAACYGQTLLELPSGKPIGSLTHTQTGGVELTAELEANAARAIKRGAHAEKRFFNQLRRAAGVFSGSAADGLSISGSDAIYSFLTQGCKKLGETAELIASDRVKKLTVSPPGKVSVGVSLTSGLLNLSLDTDIPLDELHSVLSAYREKRRYYRLKSGAFLELEENGGLEGLSLLENGLQLDEKKLKSGGISVPAFRAMYLDGLFTDQPLLNAARSEAFDGLIARFKAFQSAECPEPASLCGTLREYQRAGYRWLRCLEECSFCGILADDMGLGKTIQLIAVLLAHYESANGQAPSLPSLIVCPSSLVLNWKKEIERFAPSLSVRVVQGGAAARAKLIKAISGGEIVVTSYDLLKRDCEEYAKLRFHYFAIDEAQYIKNHTTQTAESVKRISCVQRFALTGTPIENRLSELWSIFDFLMPGYLYKYARFKKQFELPIVRDGDETARASLRSLVMPFILRRLKRDVLSELPPKTTVIVPVELCPKQMELYSAALLNGLGVLKDETGGAAKIQALALLTRLRRLCCDPSLCFEAYKHESSKLEACMELLLQAKSGGHRALLFSQYTDMLDIIQARAESEGFSFLRLQGSTPPSTRLALVESFNAGGADVFLISLKAGGTGLNLTGADTVIHYDPWWNTAAQDQATDRAHRIGQTSSVQVYKLIAQNTIEEKILELQQKKDALASIIDGDSVLSEMSVNDIIALLRSRD